MREIPKLLLVFMVEHGESSTCYWVVAGNSRAGQVPFRCLCYQLVAVPSLDHILEYIVERAAHVKTHRQLNFGGEVTDGMRVMKTHWDLGGKWWRRVNRATAATLPATVKRIQIKMLL